MRVHEEGQAAQPKLLQEPRASSRTASATLNAVRSWDSRARFRTCFPGFVTTVHAA